MLIEINKLSKQICELIREKTQILQVIPSRAEQPIQDSSKTATASKKAKCRNSVTSVIIFTVGTNINKLNSFSKVTVCLAWTNDMISYRQLFMFTNFFVMKFPANFAHPK